MNSSGTIKLIDGGVGSNKEVHIFPKGICPKVNAIANSEFKIGVTVKHVNH